MQPHQQRVIDEKTELDKKISDLSGFTKTETFVKLSVTDRELLREQEDLMTGYSRVLGRRIAHFSKKPSQYGYGYCPKCGAPGISREKRLDGYDQCSARHMYKSSEAKSC